MNKRRKDYGRKEIIPFEKQQDALRSVRRGCSGTGIIVYIIAAIIIPDSPE